MQNRMFQYRRDTDLPDDRDSILRVEQSFGRRAALRGAVFGASGLAAAALIGCGGDDDTPAPSGTAASGTPAASLKTTDPRPAQLPAGWAWDADAPFPTDFPEPSKTPKP